MANPTPQQNQNVAPQQNIDADVLALIKGKNQPSDQDRIQSTKLQLEQAIKNNNLDPNKIVRAGNYAYQILQNPKSWKEITQQAIQEGIATPEDLKTEPTKEQLVQVYASAQVVKKLILEGKQ